MRQIPIVLRDAFSQINRYLGLMLVTNAGAALLSIPIVLVAVLVLRDVHGVPILPVVIVALIGIFPSPAAAGAQFVAHETANRDQVLWRDQIDGLREYGKLALLCWVVSVLVGILLAANCVFYLQHTFPLAGLIALLFLMALVWWALCHLYVYPLLIEQEQKRLLLIYRNALLIALSRPIFTIVLGGIWLAALVLLSVTALIAIFGLVLCAQIQQNAAAVILPSFQKASAEE